MERRERAVGESCGFTGGRIAGERFIRCTFVYFRGWGRLDEGEIVDLGGLWRVIFVGEGRQKGQKRRSRRKNVADLRFRWGMR